MVMMMLMMMVWMFFDDDDDDDDDDDNDGGHDDCCCCEHHHNTTSVILTTVMFRASTVIAIAVGIMTDVGGCQKYGPLLGPLSTRCCIILRTPRGTHNFDSHSCHSSGSPWSAGRAPWSSDPAPIPRHRSWCR